MIIYTIFVILPIICLIYIFNNIDSVPFDRTKNIVFYIPIFYNYYLELPICLSHISKPIREQFITISNELFKLYDKSLESKDNYKLYTHYRLKLIFIYKNMYKVIKPCNSVSMENNLINYIPIFLNDIYNINKGNIYYENIK